ncbi:Peptidyl-prolyl cis-trans isomerase [Plasmodiophora brassicae]|uniref:Peptidyl-prolyl cis-trans isomerase n=1 Tax=Plasmodiophora brassicae TaxID=37360 RepID=A0A0G4INN8_PLABS|nr:hypothetical protein PBRA_005408 [Plasmodiophora brassicae]SPR00656.1 unnamed protein product [Plasmodiophora brassicae]
MSVTVHTSAGDLKIEIACDLVPGAAKNFLALCASGAYDNTLFHRVIPGFMVQGGDPTGTGKGGRAWNGDFLKDEFHASLRHDRRGVVAFANRGPNTNASQFYITFAAAPHLDNTSTIFGSLIDGFSTLDAIEKVPIGDKHRPVTDIVISSVTIHANPIADLEA